MINKIHIICDKNKISQKIKIIIQKKIKSTKIINSDIIIILGGDGFMLQTLKKHYNLNKPFYGINTGNYGFLMNKFSSKNFLKNLNNSKAIKINPLEMIVITKNNIKKKSIAINEIAILRQSRQAASLKILCGKVPLIKKLISDGVMVCTPAGSTAYNLSVHGPILNLDSKKLAITPISPFRPRRWIGKVISEKSIITIKNIDIKKRPISAVADNIEVRNAKTIKIRINKSIHFNLLYDKNNTLHKKIKIEQIRNEIT
tara:strand:- start:958 stop:1731 length:774 start_codon:yes stop_codon:yes gene_type:complete